MVFRSYFWPTKLEYLQVKARYLHVLKAPWAIVKYSHLENLWIKLRMKIKNKPLLIMMLHPSSKNKWKINQMLSYNVS